MKKYGLFLLSAAFPLFLGAATPLPPSGGQLTHTVVAGESISLICIDYYGYYSDALGKAVAAGNSGIKNIDIIYAGQVLELPKPVESAKAAPAPAPDTMPAMAPPGVQNEKESLFVKKMSISQGVVTCVEGTVFYRRSTAAKQQPLKINTIVSPGNVIETGADGRVEIIINREAVVRLRENTRTVLEAFRTTTAGPDKTRINCSIGGLWTKVRKFKDRFSRFELELPTAVAGVHGTVYETAIAPDSSAEVKVFSGEVAVSSAMKAGGAAPSGAAPTEVPGPQEVAPPQEVTMEHWTQIVRSMQKIAIDKKGTASSPVTFSKNTSSDWERWNETRDVRIAALFGERDQ